MTDPLESGATVGPNGDVTLVPSIGRRLTARLVDIVTVLTWMWALSVAQILFFLRWSDDVAPSPWGTTFLFALTFFVLYTIYEVGFVARTGATPGKDLMRLRIVDATSGKPPSFRGALERSLPLSVVWLVPGLWWAVPLTGALGATGLPDRRLTRTAHDRLSNTYVVHEPEVGLHSGRDPQEIERARARRREHFTPLFVNPLQIVPSQQLRLHEELRRRHGGEDDNDSGGGVEARQP